MIIKRTDKDDKIKVIYQSSNILASTYDKTNNNLTIIFNKGGSYTYPNVDETDYLRLELAESVGKAFNAYIKKYPFEKNEDVDVTKIHEEIKKTEEAAIKGMTELLSKEMKNIADFQAEYGIIEDHQIKSLEATIRKYKEVKGIKPDAEIHEVMKKIDA